MNTQAPRGPFGQPLNIAVQGAMAFAPQMHGSSGSIFGAPQPQFTQAGPSFCDTSFMDMSEVTAKKIAELQAKLNKKLGPEYISQRPGPGGGQKLTYVEGWKIINLANEVFGFNGWSSSIVNITADFIDYSEESRRYNVGVTAVVRVTLRDGVFHEDVGYGLLENSKSKGGALDKCKKEAVTDALKRTLRNFGNLLGNCLYDKAYAQEVIKIKVPPPKFDRSELHRRPEFEEAKPNLVDPGQASTGVQSFASTSYTSSSTGTSRPVVKHEPESTSMPPPAHIPQHSVPNILQPLATSTPNVKAKTAVGLPTPVQTPAGPQVQRRPVQAAANGAGMAGRTAERHAARLKAIQDAQDALKREQEAARITAAAQPSAGSSAVSNTAAQATISPQVADKPENPVTVDEDEFLFPSDDDALFASVNLDALDEGIGRPIDFEEGGNVTMAIDGEDDLPSAIGAGNRNDLRNAVEGVPRTVTAPPSSDARTRSSSNVPECNLRQQNQNPPPSSAPRGTSLSSVERPQTPSMGGGFNFPSGRNPSTTSTSTPVAAPAPPHAGSNLGSGPNVSSSTKRLKRTADIMQGINAGLAQARRPQQGMGLQNPPVPAASGSASRREPFSALELSESGDVKRARRQ